MADLHCTASRTPVTAGGAPPGYSQRFRVRNALRGVQAKLRVSQPGDASEREADTIANAIAAAPGAMVQLKCRTCEEEEKREIRRQSASPESAAPTAGEDVVSALGPGRPLDAAAMDFFEPRFGVAFRDVRVHTGAAAAESARALNAHAYTLGKDIVFGAGEYQTQTEEGRHLLAHELTHVVQQQGQASDRSRVSAEQGVSLTPSGPVAQRDLLDTAGFAVRQGFERGTDGARGQVDSLEAIFDGVVASNIAVASEIRIPSAWRTAAFDYAMSNYFDGVILLAALGRDPSYYRGGWIMDLQPNAGAMTLDHSIFVPGGNNLSLKTYIHELVHVTQFGALGPTVFLTSYFGASAANIAYRWLTRQPLNPMRSSPHEEQAYQLADRFASWYTSARGSDPRTVTV